MRPMLIAAAVVLLALAGCGKEDEPSAAASGDKPTIRNGEPDPWTEQQIIDALKLRYQPDEVTESGALVPTRPAKPGDLDIATASGCHVSVLMTSAAAVELYAEAGDTVVTNPDGTAGVKTGNDPRCLAELERGLAALK